MLLAGVAINTLTGENNIFNNAINAVEEYNKAQVKEKIEMAIIEKELEEERKVSLDEIIDKLIEKGITTEEQSDREIGTVVTEEGYLATIEEKEEGVWQVIIGEKGTAKIRLNINKEPEGLTSKVTIKIEGKLIGAGLKELNMPDGSKKEYEEGITKIEERYEVRENAAQLFAPGKYQSGKILLQRRSPDSTDQNDAHAGALLQVFQFPSVLWLRPPAYDGSGQYWRVFWGGSYV